MFNVNDILVLPYGYNCRLVSFYKVIEVTKTGKTVKLRQLKNKIVSHDGYGQAGTVIADSEFDDEEILTRRVIPTDWDKRPCVKIYENRYAKLWDGKEVAFDSYD